MSFGADENDVLLAVVRWLCSNGWRVAHFSTATGQPGGSVRRAEVQAEILRITSVPAPDEGRPSIRFGAPDVHEGLDVIATHDTVTWGIECKAQQRWQGQDSKPDMALANICWWYGWPQHVDTPPITRTGLAVPDQSRWRASVRELSPLLRQKLNLWILWVDRGDGATVSPEAPPIDCREPTRTDSCRAAHASNREKD
jgi:hypothetical protein